METLASPKTKILLVCTRIKMLSASRYTEAPREQKRQFCRVSPKE